MELFSEISFSEINKLVDSLYINPYFAITTDVGKKIYDIVCEWPGMTLDVCLYEGIKYVICFDTWPGLEEMLFLTIEPGTNAEKADVESFIDLLGIETSKIKRKKVDVDTEYMTKYGKPASLIEDLQFDFFDLKPIGLIESEK